MLSFPETWYRIGIFGDPSHDWDNTFTVIGALRHAHKIPIITTKHWIPLNDRQISKAQKFNVIIQTSVSPLDTYDEIKYRVDQLFKLRDFDIRSVCRVVTCKFGSSIWAKEHKEIQDYLLSLVPVIDTPLRLSKSNPILKKGDIMAKKKKDSIGGGGKTISLHSEKVHLGSCGDCNDQCGVDDSVDPVFSKQKRMQKQLSVFEDKISFLCIKSVIGSGFEDNISRLALADGIAHRAARKNMQIHSAIILEINDEFSGFFTFQNNHNAKEFCLLQSVIKPEIYTNDLYKQMVLEVIKQNKKKYPAIITTNPKSKFETPKLFESLGFKTYLEMSGFCYMVYGDLSQVRMKILAHIAMTNVWNSTKGKWLQLKKELNKKIDEAGVVNNIKNPKFATREGAWQGKSGFSNVVTGRSHNANTSVLDPVVCEIVLRLFMPSVGKRIYNPFGGGVQFGFIAGLYGYTYISSEIRQNQCDANNIICQHLKTVKWIKSDSSKYIPRGNFDLVFTCPPYYKVEKYCDYDGQPPEGEINTLENYEQFKAALFSGYKIAIDRLNENCFFAIMVGDSRDSSGKYYGCEAETELFLRDSGLSLYNKIVYLESEFTRLAQAKKTLDTRKYPKREQKIIIAYKGDMKKIKDLYPTLGRL
jgi:hypothetical protein